MWSILRLMGMAKPVVVGLALLAMLGLAFGVWRVARDEGAFGCAYTDRPHTAVWHLSPDGTSSSVRVRIGEGVVLRSPEAGGLRDVVVDDGGAGLAPGTQNGVTSGSDYVFRVTGAGGATVRAKTQPGATLLGRLHSTC